jgi:hypothetical protein
MNGPAIFIIHYYYGRQGTRTLNPSPGNCFRGSLLFQFAYLPNALSFRAFSELLQHFRYPSLTLLLRKTRDSNPQAFRLPAFQTGPFPFGYLPSVKRLNQGFSTGQVQNFRALHPRFTSGESGIRTLGGFTLGSFQGCCIRPLCQLSMPDVFAFRLGPSGRCPCYGAGNTFSQLIILARAKFVCSLRERLASLAS